jgi:serine/threonine-protein kinase HipA
MSRRARVFFRRRHAGILSELPDGRYRFAYEPAYLASGPAISLTLPLQAEPFESEDLFPFFAGLVPEGWYLRIVAPTLKVDPDDTFGLLLHACQDCVGAISLSADDGDVEPTHAARV